MKFKLFFSFSLIFAFNSSQLTAMDKPAGEIVQSLCPVCKGYEEIQSGNRFYCLHCAHLLRKINMR